MLRSEDIFLKQENLSEAPQSMIVNNTLLRTDSPTGMSGLKASSNGETSQNQQLGEVLRSHTINYNGNTYAGSDMQREYEIKILTKRNKEPLGTNDCLLHLQCFMYTQRIYNLKVNDHFYFLQTRRLCWMKKNKILIRDGNNIQLF